MNQNGHMGRELTMLINKAMEDGKVTNKEYDEIIALVNADSVIDTQERRLLNQLQEMIESKAVLRVTDE